MTEEELRAKRFDVVHASEGLGKFLDYQRSRLRVARATAFNAVLTVPAAVVFLADGTNPSAHLVLPLALAAALLILASAYSAIAITGAWEDSVADAHLAVERKRHADSGGDEPPPSG